MAGNDLKESHKVVNVVRGKKDSREIIDVLNLNKENSVLGLYFSAHWYRHCIESCNILLLGALRVAPLHPS